MIKLLFLILLALLWTACGSGRRPAQQSFFTKENKAQHFTDVTTRLFPTMPEAIRMAVFAPLTPDKRHDSKRRGLILLKAVAARGGELAAYLSTEKDGFISHPNSGLDKEWPLDTRFIAAGDLNMDGAPDLVLLGVSGGKPAIHFLLNNKKGYFYTPDKTTFPPLKEGVEQVDLMDIDHDGALDLFFTGRHLTADGGKTDPIQAQIVLNKGKGVFVDSTSLLLPPIRRGVIATAIADYDGDDFLDIFLVYGDGHNALLINNGLGELKDLSRSALPPIVAQSTSADWADFDGDGDNDLLVATASIKEGFRDLAEEHCYFLENDGKGRFVKRSLKLLPQAPTQKVYLLDVDENEIPDIILLSEDKPRLLVGKGKWSFSEETSRRLPASPPLQEMAFGDFNGDGLLDILATVKAKKKGRLWINQLH